MVYFSMAFSTNLEGPYQPISYFSLLAESALLHQGTTVETYQYEPEYTDSCEMGRARERGELGAVSIKIITPGKIVPYKSCLPGSNISVKDFDTDVLFN